MNWNILKWEGLDKTPKSFLARGRYGSFVDRSVYHCQCNGEGGQGPDGGPALLMGIPPCLSAGGPGATCDHSSITCVLLMTRTTRVTTVKWGLGGSHAVIDPLMSKGPEQVKPPLCPLKPYLNHAMKLCLKCLSCNVRFWWSGIYCTRT